MERSHDIPRDDLTEPPLFPLNDMVLFPGMKLPPQIFEERCEEMIVRCSEAGSPFGVLLIKEGQEVGEPAEPCTIGTTARISQVQRLEDGRMNILTEGERRFRVKTPLVLTLGLLSRADVPLLRMVCNPKIG